MLPSEYASWSEEQQVSVLQQVARTAAQDFGLELAGEPELVLHGYNTTFAVRTSDGPEAQKYAMRVLTNSDSDEAALLAQIDWTLALAEETDVLVPKPIRTRDGSYIATVEVADLGGVRTVLNSWLEGPDLEEVTPEQAHALGRVMATLHEHAETWQLPAGTALAYFTEPFMGSADVISDHPDLTDEERAVVREVLGRCQAAFDRVGAAAKPLVIHGDLHGANLKWQHGRISVFDFDDAGFGSPALDLAISTFYQRASDPAVEQALRDGYSTVRELPAVDDDDFEALVASRQLLLCSSMYESTTAGQREHARRYGQVTLERLGTYLRTGRAVLDPPFVY